MTETESKQIFELKDIILKLDAKVDYSFSVFSKDIKDIKSDVSVLKNDVSKLKVDVIEIKSDLTDLTIFTKNSFDDAFKLLYKMEDRMDVMEGKMGSMENKMDDMESDISDIKEDIGEIEKHIGRYEIRSQNIEQILLQDHKPRIIELERKVFA